MSTHWLTGKTLLNDISISITTKIGKGILSYLRYVGTGIDADCLLE